ncbi:MAG: 30S ribosomal protein S3 [Candidatus Kerfeldbacteria bacterium RIFCSPLOWO2_01_FULL_48_11]|uniref:Small ribosomal subunit protein uS3 n=1 Tax=Candidatus Kerfeldbacteria bacterium RIFCSPLOWO2_01_FULL_48_11 TaxID=1798543 RepID=A0A1G2B5X0_9BACT|nr:MAG: 30S ribosomal protein S3 [Candidatus Kerfeldbacteria bacterium RIFCSPLOWO2_01_FULL_48_11]
MGQKVHPKIFRMGITQQWQSKWFAKKQYAQFLEQDLQIRRIIKDKFKDAGVASVDIERSGTTVTIMIHTSRPGVVIGRGGAGVEELRTTVAKKFFDKKQNVRITIEEVAQPLLNAQIVCQNMIEQIEKRIPFRRVLKTAVDQARRAGAKGVKSMVAGRLGGAEIARTEKLTWGSLPLHTLRADIEYARGTAQTTYGTIGVKVWVYKGEVFSKGELRTPDTKA